MISVNNLTVQFGKKPLFENVNIQFTEGNCYGLIGANGAGKSTFLKVLAGDIEASKGEVAIASKKRMAVLRQDHFVFDEEVVLDTVLMGHERLFSIMKEKEKLYALEDFTDEDGIKLGELESEFAELDGWNAESDIEMLLNNLGVGTDSHYKKMSELDEIQKVKVLLAQALFGNPDILLLDEPTNHLDIEAIAWLEDFLADFQNTVIIVSHDRHFLNQVCTHIADIDFGKIQLYLGNYDFWYESSQLALRQMKDENKKNEAKAKEMMDFIRRFSAIASKSKQATSRKKLLDKINLDDIKPSSRRYPFVSFKQNREVGNEVLNIEGLTVNYEGEQVLNNLDLVVRPNDKIAFVGPNTLAKTALFKTVMGELEATSGSYKWGVTITNSYFPKDNNDFFNVDLNLVDWLRQYSEDKTETFVRSFLGRMLFTGEDSLKKANVLSGGEKVRCMLSKMMLSGANVILLDEPTNHLDLESITALNNGMIDTTCTVLFTSHDHQFIQTIANRIIEIGPKGVIDRMMTYDEYLESKEIQELRKTIY
ncbi:MAG: ABC-F family ATP-binding cassette domain-containing protein [Lachnospirales bacterium]